MVSRSNPERSFYYGWVIVFASLAIIAVVVGLSNGFGVFFKPLLQEFGWTRAVTASIFSLGNIFQGATAILVGLVSNRYGSRKLLFLAGILVGVSLILASGTTTLWQFYIYFGLLLGIGRGIPYNLLMAVIARWFTHRRGLAIGVTLSGGGLGTILIPLLANFLIERFDWRTTFLVFGLLLGGIIIAGCLLVRARPPQTSPSEEGTTPAESLLNNSQRSEEGMPLTQTLSSRAFWLVIVEGFLSNLSMSIVFVHLVAYATDMNVPATVAASFISVIGVANIIGKIGMGTFSDRYGIKLGLVICFSLGTATMFWLTQASAIWMFYIFSALFGLAYAGWLALFPALVGQLFGIGNMAAVLGFLVAANVLGGAVGAYLAGYIFDVTNSYQWAFILAGLGLAIAIPCQLMVRPSPKLTPQLKVGVY